MNAGLMWCVFRLVISLAALTLYRRIVADDLLFEAAVGRELGRIPVLCYYLESNGAGTHGCLERLVVLLMAWANLSCVLLGLLAGLCRSAQPMRGRTEGDEALMVAMARSSPGGQVCLYLIGFFSVFLPFLPGLLTRVAWLCWLWLLLSLQLTLTPVAPLRWPPFCSGRWWTRAAKLPPPETGLWARAPRVFPGSTLSPTSSL